ncbi:MAG: flagellin [Roseburia sp.]
MKINYNMSAVVANKHLLGIEDNLKTSMERLSSGLKINKAGDNPAGMAISRKMHAQIEGLSRASENASDGISVLQIADGALAETTSILQRMRELSVQAASDATMTPADKQAIQDEIESLKEEIDRISRDTEYNSKSLLDGSMDTRVYTNNATRVRISDYVVAGNYSLTIDSAATNVSVDAATGVDYTDNTATVGESGSISINGSTVEISATDTFAEAFEKIRDAAEMGNVTASRDETDQHLTLTSDIYGVKSGVDLEFSSQDLATALGFTGLNATADGTYVNGTVNADGTVTYETGDEAQITLDLPGDGTGFQHTATIDTDGNKITITDNGGFSISFLAQAGYEDGAAVDPNDPAAGTYDGRINFEVTDMGTMTLHIGSNEHQNMEVRIEEVSCESLYIDDVDVRKVNGGAQAMTRFDEAIAQVTSVRSKLGAYQNRLESSVASLDAFEENMTDALSRLTDVDMAEEMTNYTQQNVLNQAAISVLTQANDLPQQVLQILQ